MEAKDLEMEKLMDDVNALMGNTVVPEAAEEMSVEELAMKAKAVAAAENDVITSCIRGMFRSGSPLPTGTVKGYLVESGLFGKYKTYVLSSSSDTYKLAVYHKVTVKEGMYSLHSEDVVKGEKEYTDAVLTKN